MSKFDLKSFGTASMKFMRKNSPQLKAAAGIIAFGIAIYTAAKAAPEAKKQIEDKKAELNKEKLTPVETVKATWKCYIPTASAACAGVGFIVSGCQDSIRRTAAIGTAYALKEAELINYKRKVGEIVDDATQKAISKAVTEDSVKDKPVPDEPKQETKDVETMCSPEIGDTLFYDKLSGRYFWSSVNHIERSVIRLNKRLGKRFGDDVITLNEFYDEENMSNIEVGSMIGWRATDDDISVEFEQPIATSNGKLAVPIGFNVVPIYFD